MDTADYLLEAWPEELNGLRVEISDIPAADVNAPWFIDRKHRRIIFHRVPIERNARRRRDVDSRQIIEFTVARALSEFAGNAEQ